MKELIKKFGEHQRKNYTHTACIGFITDVDEVHFSGNYACHAGLIRPRNPYSYGNRGDMNWEGRGKITHVLSGIQARGNLDRTNYVKFINYMVNESRWKDIFVEKDPEKVYEENWLIDADQPCNFMANGAIATRLPSEFPSNFEAWLDMYNNGVDGDQAYITSMFIAQSSSNGDTFSPYSLSGHIPFCSNDPVAVRNFIKNTPIKGSLGGLYSKEERYTNNNGVWSENDYGMKFKNLDTIMPPTHVEVKSLNIFYKEKVDPSKRHFKKGADLVYFSNRLKELANAA